MNITFISNVHDHAKMLGENTGTLRIPGGYAKHGILEMCSFKPSPVKPYSDTLPTFVPKR